MLPQTLKTRTFLTFAVIFVALLAAGGVFVEVHFRRYQEREVARRLEVVANLLVDDAAGAFAGGDSDVPSRLARRLDPLGDAARLRVTLIDAEGKVHFDSQAELPMSNHALRPEIVAARTAGHGLARRRSATTGVETFYFARRIDGDGEPAGFVRVADDVSRIDAEVAALRRGLLIGGLGALLLVLAGSLFVSRWLVRPLSDIQRTAAAVAGGDLEHRVRASGPIETHRLAASLNRMADQLRGRIDGLQMARNETEAILASLSEGVIAVDPDERLIHMNETAAKQLGLREKLPVGAALWKEVRFPELEKALRDVLAGESGWQGDSASPRYEGRVLHIAVAPVRPGIGAVAVLADITEIRRLEQIRIDFVANVSHELRTPLAALMGAIETLSEPGGDEKVRSRFVDIGRRNADRLMAMVTDLLELSRIETEGAKMPVEPLCLNEIVRSVARSLSSAADRKGLTLRVETKDGAPYTVSGNARRLEQVFTNLIDNAIKYTPAGGTVVTRVRGTADDIVVDVEDTGMGIPAESLPRVFERFYRVDRSRSREMGGTGLGLAIVKHAVLAHGGRVNVRSEEGRGSTFTVTLPRA